MKHTLLSKIMVLLLLTFAHIASAVSTVSAPFTGTPIAAGNRIWFNAEMKLTGPVTYPLTIYFTDQVISSPLFSFSVPDAVLVLDPSVTTARTVFNGTNWVTYARPGEPGYYFLSGYNRLVTSTIPGSLSPVSWTGTFKASRPGVSVLWHMAAAVYTSLSPDLNTLGVKPSDCHSCSAYTNSHSAGSPENFLPYVIGGARGGGGSNYTGGKSGGDHETPDLAIGNVSVCVGGTTTVAVPVATGSWSSSNTAVATVAGGIVTGVAAGTARISYAIPGCPVWQTVNVTVNAAPSVSASGPAGPVCAGSTVYLHASGAGGSCGGCGSSGHCGSGTASGCGGSGSCGSGGSAGSYAWSGPVGFASVLQHPVRAGCTVSMGGVYSVSYTDAHGCSSTATTNVIVNKLPSTVTATVSPVPACVGAAISLNGTVAGGSGYTILWTGGSSAIINDTTANASIASAALTDAGTYSLTAVAAGCTAVVRGTAVLPALRKLPTTLTASVNPAVVCQGGPVALIATSSGSSGTVSYAWSKPAGGNTIMNATSLTSANIASTNYANAGVYTLTATVEGCGTRTAYTGALQVNKLPTLSAMASPTSVCVGGSFSLTGTVVGGSGYTLLWTGGTGTIVNNTTANAHVVSAVAGNAGGYTLTATAPACGSTAANTNAAPIVIGVPPMSTGPTNNGPVCAGGSVLLSANSTGATAWSWTGPGGFTSSLQNATVTPAVAGIYSLTLGNPASGCTWSTVYTTTVTVGAGPTSTGATNSGPVCAGSTATLYANSTGATAWSWTGPGGFSSTLQNPACAATSTGTYSLVLSNPTAGCSSPDIYTTTLVVNPLPTSTGATSTGPVCAGSSVTLYSNATNATNWSWSGPGGYSSTEQNPVITPSATGTYWVTLSNMVTGCTQTAVYTTLVPVTPLPAVTAGANTTICAGSTSALSAAGASSYSWAPSTGLSSVSGADVVASPAATTIYTVTGSNGGCSNTATVQVSVNALPAISTGSDAAICAGASATLSASGATTYSWAPGSGLSGTTGSSVTASPSVNTTYTVTGTADGCSNVATVSVSINPLPDAGTISGPGSVCAGSSIAMVNCAAGTWSSSTPAVATITTDGVVAGVAAGTTIISFTVSNSCGGATATKVVTVHAIPASLTGPSSVDIGSDVLFTLAGGSWSSSDPTIATVDGTGTVTGVNGGTALISYSMSNSCFSFVVTKPISVNAVSVMPITGTLTICEGSTTTLADATVGGAWSSDNTAVATVTSSGIVTGVAAGTATISYAVASSVVSVVVTVNGLPPAITGNFNLCLGSTTVLANAEPGGTWSVSPSTIAAIDASGLVTPSALGTAVVTYTLGTGCFATEAVTVSAGPAVPGGALTVCMGATTNLSTTATGGAWATSNAAIATVSSTGVVTGVATGTAAISYTLASGCASSAEVTVTPIPTITGTLTVCQGSSTTLTTDVDGGTWTSSNTSVATVSSIGVVTGMAGGTARITYVSGAGCSASAVVTVSAIQVISGANVICVGTTATLTNATGGGTWSSSNTGVATVGSTTGVVTGVSAGSATITYRLSNGCTRTTNVTVTVLTPITGTLQACVGLTTSLANATPGGTWSSSPTSIATIGGTTGIANGINAGTANITYSVGSCRATAVLTVVASPAAITGPSAVCVGFTITVSDATSGGTWSTASGNVSISGTSSPVLAVTGVSAGLATLTYTAGAYGCYRTYNVAVGAPPAAIAGSFTVCPGGVTTLTNSTSGGTWSSGNTAIATIAPTLGHVSGIASGTVNITYTTGAGCAVSTEVTVIASPSPIEGPGIVCTGSTITLSNPSGSGTWTSSNVGIASVGVSTGVVTGVVAGMPNITFTLASTGCKVKRTVTVTAIPNAGTLSGPTTVAVGGTITLTSTGTAGGAWSSSGAEATVGTSGVVTGVSAGSATITYAVVNACGYSGAYKPISIAAARGTGGGGSTTLLQAMDNVVSGDAAGMEISSPGAGSRSAMVVGDRTAGSSVVRRTIPRQAISGGVSASPVRTHVVSEIRLVPNPNNGTFLVQGNIGKSVTGTVNLEIRNMAGQLVYTSAATTKNGVIDQQVQLDSSLANGMYTLTVRSNSGQKVSHFVLER